MAQGGGQVNVTQRPRRDNTPYIVAAVIIALLLLALILWLILRPKDNGGVAAATATPTTAVVVVTETPAPPTNTPQVVQVVVTPTPEPPTNTPLVVVVTNTPGPAQPTNTPVVVVVTNTPAPEQPTKPAPTTAPTQPAPTTAPTQPPPTPTTVPTMTSEESQIATVVKGAPNGDQIVYVHYDGSNIQVFFKIVPKPTLPDAALQAKEQVKDILQMLEKVTQNFTQATITGTYAVPANGTPSPQAGQEVPVVQVTYDANTVKNTDWGNSPPEPVYEKATNANISPQFNTK